MDGKNDRWCSLVMGCALLLGVSLLIGAATGAYTGGTSRGYGQINLAELRDVRHLQRAPVAFDHDAHTDEIHQCTECHEKGALKNGDFSFQRGGIVPRPPILMDAYHKACMGCHEARRKAHKRAGPLSCGECHLKGAAEKAIRLTPRFDYLIHSRHVMAADSRCGVCHHVYDQRIKLLLYREGMESSCRECHGKRSGGWIRPFRLVAHTQCLSCHREKAEGGKKRPPTRCSGCHGPLKPLPRQRVPRLKAGQQDEFSIKASWSNMPAVPFEHKAHEGRVKFCSDCHHIGVRPCDSCHRAEGQSRGGWVSLEDAFHREGSGLSCVGCHLSKIRSSKCIGCHKFLPSRPTTLSCWICHSKGKKGRGRGKTMVDRGSFDRLNEGLPERLQIVRLQDQYKPAPFPHKKILKALNALIEDSPLGERFHPGRVMCAGCHHHTPISTFSGKDSKPPKCESCHAIKADTRLQRRPLLLGAFHRMCIGCHEGMEVKRTGCTDCHKESR